MKPWSVRSTILVAVASAALMVFGAGAASAFEAPMTSGGWYWQNPLVQGNSLNGVAVTATNAIAVGDAGVIRTSADGGVTWTRRSSGMRAKLLAVDCFSASTGWAVGNGGVIKTTDGGATWVAQDLPGAGVYRFTDVSFFDASRGWACGSYSVNGGGVFSRIVRTIDGGATWTVAKQWTSGSSKADVQRLMKVDFVSATTGWATGWGYDVAAADWGYVVLKTSDAGDNWLITRFGDGRAAISAMDFTSVSDGWLATASLADYHPATIWKTTDGGATWVAQTTKDGATITDLAASAAGECYASGQTQGVSDWVGFVLHSGDNGATWTQEYAQETVKPEAVGFASTSAVAVGAGALFLSRDAATGIWTQSAPGVRTNLTNVQFRDSSLGWAVGWKSTILRTTNGGREWKSTSVPSGISIEGIDMVTSKIGWAVGCSGPHVPYADLDAGYGAVVLRTSDGGLHWKYQIDRTATPGLAAVDFTDTKHGVAVGTSGVTVRTTDGGNTWWFKTVGSATLRDVQFTDASNGVAVGGDTGSLSGNGSIWKTNDGGVKWAKATFVPEGPLDRTPRAPLRAVKVDPGSSGLTAIGDNSQMYTSSDGSSWTYNSTFAVDEVVQDPPFYHFMDVGLCVIPETKMFLLADDDADGWALGNDGAIWTRNGGEWQLPPTISSFSPTSGPAGTTVTLYGRGFLSGWKQETTATVSFADAVVPGTIISDTQIQCVAGARTGKIEVTTSRGTGTSVDRFVVPGSEPVVQTHLLNHSGGSGQDNQLNGLAVVDWLNAWAVGERGTILSFDRLQPATTFEPSNGWLKAPSVSLAATDAKSGVAWTRWIVDPPINGDVKPPLGDWDSWAWQYGTVATFSAVGDAPGTRHVIYYQSLDNVGNIELDPYWLDPWPEPPLPYNEVPKHVWVTVDTIGPQTYAPWPVSVVRNARPAFTFWVNDDLSNKANVTIVIKDPSAKTVKTLSLGWLATWKEFSAPITSWKCTLAKGAYTFTVQAQDQAGNTQIVPAGGNTFTVN